MAAPKGNKYGAANKGNQFAVGNKGASIWKTPKELEDKIKGYYKHCEDDKKPLTVAGLGLWLGVDRHTIYRYEQKDEFAPIIKNARDHVLTDLEERIATEGRAGQIFLAKNYGYTDQQDVKYSGSISHPFANLNDAEVLKLLENHEKGE